MTFWNFLGMGVATGIVIAASNAESLPAFVAGFVLLFLLSGLGNGSTYKMIPSIFGVQARVAIENGADEKSALLRARRISGAVIGIAGAVGALGGLFINLAFRESFASASSGDPAFWVFLAFYGVFALVTYVAYLRPALDRASAEPRLTYAGV